MRFGREKSSSSVCFFESKSMNIEKITTAEFRRSLAGGITLLITEVRTKKKAKKLLL